MTAPGTTALRYHALDGLRGAMMLLGIYLHVVVAYAPVGGWPFKQPELTGALSVTTALIHIFRMPIFYLMAGFFAALLYERRGFRDAATNRIGRIAIPFVVGWAILFPMVVLLAGSAKRGLPLAWNALISGTAFRYAHPLHLWFLEYLLLLYGLAVIVVPLVAALPEGWRAALNRGFRRSVESVWAPALFALPSFLALLPMHDVGFDDPPSFIPTPHILIAYAIPFAFGWLLHRNADLLAIIRQRAWTNTLWALVWAGSFIVLVGLAFAGVIHRPAPGSWLFFTSRLHHSLALWCLMLGIMGLFLRYLDRPSARWRYLCDSSYFLYIAHMPVILVFQLLLLPVGWPPLLKVPVVLVGSTAILLVIYHYTVRPSVIGAVLNGRRYPARPSAIMAASA